MIKNTFKVLANEKKEKEETVCSAATQSGRLQGMKKEDKSTEKILDKNAAESKSK